jgi:hypothetical protein
LNLSAIMSSSSSLPSWNFEEENSSGDWKKSASNPLLTQECQEHINLLKRTKILEEGF